jgi:polysaccharide export outer membrane protein
VKSISSFFLVVCIALLFISQLSAETSLDESYSIGPNDVLDIRVLDHDELRTMATVTSDGAITFPYIGTVAVKGMSLSEIEKALTQKLSEGYIKYPVVTVSLIKSLSKKIFAYGELQRRGMIPLEENITVLKALSMAGGVTENGINGKLKVGRKKEGVGGNYKDIVETGLNNGVIEDKRIENMILQPDDILIIDRNEGFLIQGETAQRGRFVLEKDMTVLNAILQSGGVTQDGRYGKIRIRRKEKSKPGGYIDIAEAELNDGVIEDKKVENMILQPDDILIVTRNKTLLIQGEVAQRGRMVLEKDMTVVKALLQAGGITSEGLYGKIKVRRKKEGDSGEYKDIVEARLNKGAIISSVVEETLLEPDDILIVERNESFLIQGEVAQRGRMVLEQDMTVLRALLQAGGVTNDGLYGTIKIRRKQEGTSGEYKDLAEAELSNGLIESREVEEMPLEPDDVLIVEPNKTFFIYGEANKTGEFVLKKDITVFKALTIAGGFTKWGASSRVKVLRSNKNNTGFEIIKVNIDDVIKGDADADMILESGDTIVISAGVF